MKKAKIITSALLGVVMCTGIICALTANAVEAPAESNQAAYIGEYTPKPFPMPIEELDALLEEQGVINTPEVQKTPLQAAIDEVFFGGGYKTSEQIENELAELGITTYPSTEPRPIEEIDAELEQQGIARTSGFPIYSHDIPYSISLGEIPAGSGIISAYYFKPAGNKIRVYCKLQAMGNPGTKTLKVTLYKENRFMAGADAWQYVESQEIGLANTEDATFPLTFTDLDSSMYIYCLRFDNATTGTNHIISGNAVVINV